MLKLFYPVNRLFLVFTDCYVLHTVEKHKGKNYRPCFFRVVLGFEKKIQFILNTITRGVCFSDNPNDS